MNKPKCMECEHFIHKQKLKGYDGYCEVLKQFTVLSMGCSEFSEGRNKIYKKEPTIDAVERIEYEKMKDLAEQYKFEYECVLEAHKEVLNEVLPKRVEVVRCKDCKWYDNIGCALIIVDEEDRPKPDDYCSYGERKKNE